MQQSQASNFPAFPGSKRLDVNGLMIVVSHSIQLNHLSFKHKEKTTLPRANVRQNLGRKRKHLCLNDSGCKGVTKSTVAEGSKALL